MPGYFHEVRKCDHIDGDNIDDDADVEHDNLDNLDADDNADGDCIAWENCFQFEVTHDRKHLQNHIKDPPLLPTKSCGSLQVPVSSLKYGFLPLALSQCGTIMPLCHAHIYH